jgi:ABC-type polysaccharide/polyol phosphate export permease
VGIPRAAFFLAWRDISVRYKQTILGAAWAIIQPFFTMLVFCLFFGRLGQIPSDGVPYPIFSYAVLLPWQYFATALAGSVDSLVGSANLLSKVYFPRLVIPMASVLPAVIDRVSFVKIRQRLDCEPRITVEEGICEVRIVLIMRKGNMANGLAQ